MATVRFSVNQLHYLDPMLAERFEREIAQAAAGLVDDTALQCRILVVEGNPHLVRIQFERPGWVKSFGLPAELALADVRRAAGVILRNQ